MGWLFHQHLDTQGENLSGGARLQPCHLELGVVGFLPREGGCFGRVKIVCR